jgi:nitroreductase
MELREVIAKRKSTRSYMAQQISAEALEQILLAGAAAPVGMGVYDQVHFTVVQDAQLLSRVSKAAAAARGSADDPLYAAPTLVLISSAAQPDPNLAYVNAACIGENIALAATELGIGNVIIWSAAAGIANDPELTAALALPAGFAPTLALVLGFPAEGAAGGAAAAGERQLEQRIATNYV